VGIDIGLYVGDIRPEVGAGAFFRTREREAKKKSAKARRKKSAKKRKRRARKKKARIRAFTSPTVEIRFQSTKPLGRGKARVLNKMYSSVGILNRQRGNDTGE
jgi:hypothetical protein